jgi:ech hydrogenase subunit D
MAEPQVFFPTDKTEIIEIAQRNKAMNYRFSQMHCVKTPAEMFIIYTFEKSNLTIEQYRVAVETDGAAPSISAVFLAAALYENEISELYGVNFTGLALDFGGTLYETAKPRAFADVPLPAEKKAKKAPAAKKTAEEEKTAEPAAENQPDGAETEPKKEEGN